MGVLERLKGLCNVLHSTGKPFNQKVSEKERMSLDLADSPKKTFAVIGHHKIMKRG